SVRIFLRPTTSHSSVPPAAGAPAGAGAGAPSVPPAAVGATRSRPPGSSLDPSPHSGATGGSPLPNVVDSASVSASHTRTSGGSGRPVPGPRRPVGRGDGRHLPAVGVEGDPGRVGPDADLAAVGGVPDAGRAVGPDGGEPAAVAAEFHAQHPARVAPQRVQPP